MSPPFNVPADASIFVDYVTSAHFDYICFFTVSAGRPGTHYKIDISREDWESFGDNDIHAQGLRKHLLQNMNRATFVRSCSDCRPFNVVKP
jgi:hypothetical protein